MRKSCLLPILLCLIAWMSSCSINNGADQKLSIPPYNPFIQAFTYGEISRYAPVYLIFNQELPESALTPEQLKKHIRIQPEVQGEFYAENPTSIQFRPKKGFERNTVYKVEVDLSDWFEAETEDRLFNFSFKTFPLALRGSFESLALSPDNENNYDLSFVLYTPDRESPEIVEKLTGFSEKTKTEWQHSPDGKKHQVKALGVPAGNGKKRSFDVMIAPNDLKLKSEELASAMVPDMQDFEVYDVQYISQPEQYIELTFTQLLDEQQSVQGLAYIADNRSDAVTVDKNKIRLYPDAEKQDAVHVHVSKNLRSKSGKTLSDNYVEQVELSRMLPAVRFVGQGVVIPDSRQLVVPFQALYLRGVVVRVIKIFEQNIGQFLQINSLDGSADLMRVGRLVALKTILFSDNQPEDYARWNTYGINLSELIEPEPGAIYRVELSFNRDLSAYPCDSVPQLSDEQLLANDALKFKEESSRFDEGGYYYDQSLNWSDYNYNERNNPCSDSYYFNVSQAKNVLATNLGIMAMAGTNNEMTVLVHNILTTSPEKGVEVKAYNYQQQEVAKGITDNKGEVRLTFDTSRPFYLIASRERQRTYLRVDGGSALSLSSFDVAGEVVQKGIKGFIYGDRGVWRPGDTLHLGFMLNDQSNPIPASHPIIIELYSPLGQLVTRKTETKGLQGLYVFDLPTEADAPTGSWLARVSVGGAVFEKRLRIETIKPNRLKIDLNLPEKTILRSEPLDARLHVEWLQGATARNMKYTIQGTFIASKTEFKGFNDYVFDNPARQFNSEESKLITGTTDASGNAMVKAQFEVGTSAPGMLLASLVTRVFEESGDFSIDATRRMYSPYKRYAGIHSPQKGEDPLDTGTDQTFEVASVSYLGQPQGNTELEVNIYKVYWYWWWSSDQSQLANYMSDSYNKPIKQLQLRTGANGKATFTLNFPNAEWGTYYISVTDKESKHASGVMSYFDWPGNEGRRNADGSSAANMLRFTVDKDSYQPGEQMVITFPSIAESRAVIAIVNGSRVLQISEHLCADKETQVKIPVTAEMQPNAYIYISLLQPHGITKSDLPIRMYGVVPFNVTSAESHLYPQIKVASVLKPQQPYDIVVSEKNGREMAYTLAIVDEGLLDLTRFRTPDPWKAFNAREALGVNVWDMYNYIVGAYGGKIEQLFSIGGDDALNKGPKAIVNRFKPVVRFEGPFLLKPGESKRHTEMMPNYSGRVRVMVVAGNGTAYGDAEKSVPVRQPVMVLGTWPAVVGTDEEIVIPATIFATEDGIGTVTVSLNASSNIVVEGQSTQTIQFTNKGDKLVYFRIRVKDQPGEASLTLSASGKGEKSTYSSAIQIRSVRTSQQEVKTVSLAPGQQQQLPVTFVGMPGTNTLALEVSDVQPVNLTGRLAYLTDYPHGCLEQIVSSAFPLLYLPAWTDMTAQQKQSAESQIKGVISRLRGYQTIDGAFAYWPGTTSTQAWSSVYATHFLLIAESKGYWVPDGMKQNALSQLARTARNWKPVNTPMAATEAFTESYRLYVLALAGMPEIGAMNRLKEDATMPDMARWMLAGAYALTGRADVGKELIRKTVSLQENVYPYDETLGSSTRDQALRLLVLCQLKESADAATLATALSNTLASSEWLSTQSVSFGLLALSEYRQLYPVAESMAFKYSYAGQSSSVSTEKALWKSALSVGAKAATPITIQNTGKSNLTVRLITEGIPPKADVKAYSNGIEMTVSYMSVDGRPISIADLSQGTSFSAVVTVKNPSPRAYNQLVLTQIFPAGWEILNTRYLNETSPSLQTSGISYQDIRDDRVNTYLDKLPAGKQITVKVDLCAVYQGRYYLPPVTCEAMYQSLIRANTAAAEVQVK